MCDYRQSQIPTQAVNESNLNIQNDVEDEKQEHVWGRLLPINSAFSRVDLKNEITTFGRRSDCDVLFTKDNPVCVLTAYSNVHFKIKREFSIKTGSHALLEDLSTNGTFINGEKLGKGRIQALKNNSEIALSKTENKAFIYIDLENADDKNYPKELREKYTVTTTLGKGAYGEVKLAFEKNTCEKYAVKIITKKAFTMNGRHRMNLNAQILSEINILKKLEHPCIIKIKEVIDTPETVFIVLELVEGGELFDKVVSLGKYDESTAKFLFYQMVLAIKYLHDEGITHRDLKPENILLSSSEDKETLVKITDFGLSKFFDETTLMKTFCGTPNYLAPEVLKTKGEAAYTNKIDNWSLGVILYICLVGYPPFSDENSHTSMEQQIIQGAYDFPYDYWSNISKEAVDLIKKLMCTDPDKRITLNEVLEHKWLKDSLDVTTRAHQLMFPSINDSNKRQCDEVTTESQEDSNFKKHKSN